MLPGRPIRPRLRHQHPPGQQTTALYHPSPKADFPGGEEEREAKRRQGNRRHD